MTKSRNTIHDPATISPQTRNERTITNSSITSCIDGSRESSSLSSNSWGNREAVPFITTANALPSSSSPQEPVNIRRQVYEVMAAENAYDEGIKNWNSYADKIAGTALMVAPDIVMMGLPGGMASTMTAKIGSKIAGKELPGLLELAHKNGFEWFRNPYEGQPRMSDVIDLPNGKTITRAEMLIAINSPLKDGDRAVTLNLPHSAEKNSLAQNLTYLGLSPEAQKSLLNKMEKQGIQLESFNKKLDDVVALQKRSVEKQQRLLEIQERKENYDNLSRLAGVISQVGVMTNCKELQVAGSIIQSGLSIAMGIDSFYTAAGAFAFSTGGLGMIAVGAIQLIGLFMKRGPDPSQIILSEINKLSNKLNTLHENMQDGFLRNAIMQQEIFNAVIDGVNLISKQINKTLSGMKVGLRVELQDIKERLQFLTRYQELADVRLLLQQLETTSARTNQILDGVHQKEVASEVRDCSRTLLSWAEKQSSNPLLTGYTLLQAAPSLTQVEEFLIDMGGKESLFLGFLSEYARKNHEAKFSAKTIGDKNISALTPSQMANPEIWYQAIQQYISLNSQFIGSDIDPDDRGLANMQAVGQRGLDFVEHIKHDESFWNNLCKYYQDALTDIQKYANEFAKKSSTDLLNECNEDFKRTAINSDVADIQGLDLLKKPETLISQFTNASLNQVHGQIKTTGPMAHVTELKENELSKSTLNKNLHSKLPASVLAANFLKKATLTMEQKSDIEGAEPRSEFSYEALVFAHEQDFWEYPQGKPAKLVRRWVLPEGLRGDAYYEAEMGPANLDSQEWILSLKLFMHIDKKAHEVAVIQFKGEWKTFVGGRGVAVYTANRLKSDLAEPIIGWDGVHYKSCGYGDWPEKGRATFREQIVAFIRDYFNASASRSLYWKRDDDARPLTVEVIPESNAEALANKEINKFYLESRKNITTDLINCHKPEDPLVEKFNNAIHRLNVSVLLLLHFAKLMGKDTEELLEELVTSKKIIAELESFGKDETLPETWLNCVTAALDAPLTYGKITGLKDSEELPRTTALWMQGLRQLEFYKNWKLLCKSIFPVLSLGVDVKDYKSQCEQARNHLFQQRVLEEFQEQKSSKFVEASSHLARYKLMPLNNKTRSFFYTENAIRILDWAILHSRLQLATGFLPSINIEALNEQTNVQLADMYLKPFGWACNIRTLMRYAHKHGDCQFAGIPSSNEELVFPVMDSDDVNPANLTMLVEGAHAYINLIVNNSQIKSLVRIAGDGTEIQINNIHAIQKIGFQLKNIINTIALSNTLFTHLFERYMQLINEPYQFILHKLQAQHAGVIELDKALSGSRNNIDVLRLLATDAYQGARDTLLDQLSTYAIWIRSYLEMCFGYYVETPSAHKITFKNKSYDLYTDKRAILAYLEEHKSPEKLGAALSSYIEQILELSRITLQHVKIFQDCHRLHQYLAGLPHDVEVLVIDKSIFTNTTDLNGTLTNEALVILQDFLEIHNISSITIDSINVTEAVLASLLTMLVKEAPHLSSLHLNNCSLTPESLDVCQAYLPRLSMLSHLDLSRNDFSTTQHAYRLADSLAALPNLVACNLASSKLDLNGMHFVVDALSEQKELRTLCLTDNNVNHRKLNNVVSLLSKSVSLIKNEAFPRCAVQSSVRNESRYSMFPLNPGLGQPALDQLLRLLAAHRCYLTNKQSKAPKEQLLTGLFQAKKRVTNQAQAVLKKNAFEI